jgi:ferritin-like metal-binding protein YciE
MAIKNPKEVFLTLLSDVRQNTERGTKFYQEVSQLAQDPEIKEALEARAFIAAKSLEKLDQCFKILGEQPVKLSGRIHDALVEDFREKLGEIQSPVAKRLFVLAKIIQVTQWRIAEYVALVAMADFSGHYGVGVLLESCLADKLAFVERTRRLIGKMAEAKAAERVAA